MNKYLMDNGYIYIYIYIYVRGQGQQKQANALQFFWFLRSFLIFIEFLQDFSAFFAFKSYFWFLKGFKYNLPTFTMQGYERCPEENRGLSYYYD